MSEYWKSTPKYWCKHCSTYVKDTPFERKQHENTGKHQGNLKRFLRGIQNDHEKGQREKERAKAEVDRLNKMVGGSTAIAGPSVSKPSTTRKTVSSSLTANDQKRQWAQLAEMGISVPENYTAEMAIAGQWQTITNDTQEVSAPTESLSTGVRKRKLEIQEGDEIEQEEISQGSVRRGWGATTKRYPGHDNTDLDSLLAGTLMKQQIKTTEPKKNLQEPLVKRESDFELGETDANTTQVNNEIRNPPDSVIPASAAESTTVKHEDVGLEGLTALESPSMEAAAAAPVFKKRKVKPKAERKVER